MSIEDQMQHGIDGNKLLGRPLTFGDADQIDQLRGLESTLVFDPQRIATEKGVRRFRVTVRKEVTDDIVAPSIQEAERIALNEAFDSNEVFEVQRSQEIDRGPWTHNQRADLRARYVDGGAA